MEKVVRSALQLSAKKNFHIGQVLIKKYGLKTVSAVQLIENRKFYGCVFPLYIKLILLHTVVVLHYTHHIQIACLIKKGMLSKCSKTNYYKSSLVANFAQVCSLIHIYNGMYTVCSYDTPQ